MDEGTKRHVKEDWHRLQQFVVAGDVQGLLTMLDTLQPRGVARAISRLSAEAQRALLAMLEPWAGAMVVTEVPEIQATSLLGLLAPAQAALIVDQLASDLQADLLGAMTVPDREAILEEMAPGEAADARALLGYAEDTAGGLMVLEFLVYSSQQTVDDVVRDLRVHGHEYSDYDVQYIYVKDGEGRLAGVLRMRDLLLAARACPLRELMISGPLWLHAEDRLDELSEFFDDHALLGVPIVDGAERLVGVLHRSAVQEAEEHRIDHTYLESSGIVGGEELRTMPLLVRARRRLSWLSVNILLNVIAASVIALYQDTLSSVIALAVFLPIVSDMSGCSGNQAVAVSIRELSMGLVRPGELWRVLSAEVRLGLLNGMVLGAFLGGAAGLWQSSAWLGAIIGAALWLNTLVSVTLGGLVPMALQRFGRDPALASGPILTTVTDICGFLMVLGFASLALPYLQV